MPSSPPRISSRTSHWPFWMSAEAVRTMRPVASGGPELVHGGAVGAGQHDRLLRHVLVAWGEGWDLLLPGGLGRDRRRGGVGGRRGRRRCRRGRRRLLRWDRRRSRPRPARWRRHPLPMPPRTPPGRWPWSWSCPPARRATVVVVVVSPGTVVEVVAPTWASAVVLGVGHRTLGELRQPEHGPEPQLGGLADQRQSPIAVLHARQLDHDGIALAGDVGLGHAEGVDPVADDLQRLVELVTAGDRPWAARATDTPPCRSSPSSGLLPDRSVARRPP